jgi:eukaryotic-like serine/threonine-protein kinase
MSDFIEAQWQRLSEILDQALGLAESERAQWLAALEQKDPDTAAQVTRMLAVQARDGYSNFLSKPLSIHSELPATPSLAGRVVGNYILEAEIGHGGMGSVWRARRADGRVEGYVAIKFLNSAWLGRDGQARFRQEGNLLARLDHPNIARLIDAGVFDEVHPYLVIEYVDGLPIDEYCEREHLGLEACLQLFRAILSAVGHAHSHLIVHRDIKPSNIFVTHGGVIKLLDFGIAKLVDVSDEAVPRKTSVRALTPQYAAPEQLLAGPVTTQTDVYALGLVLYLLLTGRHARPQDAQGAAALMRAVIDEDPPRASTAAEDSGRRRALDGDLDNILAKALKKVPGERYSNAPAFSDDLRRFLSQEPVTAGPDTARYRVIKFVQRHRGAVATSVLTGITLVLAIVITTTQWFDARHQRDVARVQLQRAVAFGDLVSIVLNESGHAGEALTTAQLLERGEKLVRSEFASSAGLRSQLLFTLAQLYSHVGATEKQRTLYRESYDLAMHSGDSGLVALSGCASAAADTVSGFGRDAAQRVQLLLAELPRDSENDEVRAACWQYASTIARFSGDGAAALADSERAGKLREASPSGGTEWGRLSSMIMLADARREAGQLGRADQTYAHVAGELTRIGVEDSGFAVTLYGNWGSLLVNLGMPARGAQLLERARMIEQGYAPSDAFLATNYAAALLSLGRAADARDVLSAALGGAVANKNRNSAAKVQMGLARTNSTLGNLEESETILSRLEPLLQNMLPPGHEAFGALHFIRAQNLEFGGDHSGALREASLAFGIFSTRPGLAHRAAEVQESMAGILLAMGNPREALAQIHRARNSFDAAFGPGIRSYYLGKTWLTEAKIDNKLADLQGARAAAHEAYLHFVSSVGETHPLTIEATALGE